jgi:hypothetical protein
VDSDERLLSRRGPLEVGGIVAVARGRPNHDETRTQLQLSLSETMTMSKNAVPLTFPFPVDGVFIDEVLGLAQRVSRFSGGDVPTKARCV